MTRTEKNWLHAVALVLASFAILGSLYLLEMNLGRWRSDLRIVPNPAEASMRYFGMSHFLIAYLFIFTSVSMRALRTKGIFALWLFAGAVLCLGYARSYVWSSLVAEAFLYTYFVAHDFRDQISFFYQNGDAPPGENPKTVGRALLLGPFLLLAAAIAAVSPLLSSGVLSANLSTRLRDALPPALIATLPLIGGAAFLAMFLSIRKIWIRERLGPFWAFLRAHRPVYLIFAGTIAILAIGQAYSIIILHVACWYVFVVRQLKARSAVTRPKPTGWAWMRGTPAGFNLLHFGSAALLLLAGSVWAYGYWNRTDLLGYSVFLAPRSFPYWTLVHVTVSWRGR